jgi:hypothetical protein
MSKPKPAPPQRAVDPLSIEELESGLRIMDDRETDLNAFWDENIAAFRQTVLLAIRETSDALLSPTMPLHWRVELQSQLETLLQYIELADRYVARRCLSFAEARREAPFVPPLVH